MTKKTLAILLSFLVAVMPFLGFPGSFKTYFYVFAGIVLMALIELISIQYCSRYDDRVDEDFDRYKDPKGSSKPKKDLSDRNEHVEQTNILDEEQYKE
ncbi:MAG: hypothetical protein KAR24_03710 [Candidatus Pacebacteria bacterium]|nr:hypothetical protein [Candidatus Paceibacterota bacterium]